MIKTLGKIILVGDDVQNSNIRRIDNLGRVVIPKDIRNKLHIMENDPLEIYIDNGVICVKSYNQIEADNKFINKIITTFNRITGNDYIIYNQDSFLYSTIKAMLNKKITRELRDKIYESESLNYSLELFDNSINIYPLIVDNDRAGALIEVKNDKTNHTDIKLLKALIENTLNNN